MCVVAAGSAPVYLTRSLPPIHNPLQIPFSLRVQYTSRIQARLPVSVDSGQGYPPITDRYLAVAAGWPAGTSLLFLDAAVPRRIRIELTPGTRLCVRRLEVITLH